MIGRPIGSNDLRCDASRAGAGAARPRQCLAQPGGRLRHRRRGRVVGRGWTQPGGRPHAETEALAGPASKARGATAYVTLEPCCHWGQDAALCRCADRGRPSIGSSSGSKTLTRGSPAPGSPAARGWYRGRDRNRRRRGGRGQCRLSRCVAAWPAARHPEARDLARRQDRHRHRREPLDYRTACPRLDRTCCAPSMMRSWSAPARCLLMIPS